MTLFSMGGSKNVPKKGRGGDELRGVILGESALEWWYSPIWGRGHCGIKNAKIVFF